MATRSIADDIWVGEQVEVINTKDQQFSGLRGTVIKVKHGVEFVVDFPMGLQNLRHEFGVDELAVL